MSVKGAAPECRHIWALIGALGEEDPSPRMMDEIAEHFARCGNCTGAEESLEEVLAVYRAQENISIPPHVEERLLDCLCGGSRPA